MEYSTGLKSNMVREMAGPEGVSATSLAPEVGIPQPTLSRWLRAAGTVAGLSRGRHVTPVAAKATSQA